MAIDRWHQVEEIFHDALALAPVERAAFVAAAADGDAALQDEVMSLLAFDPGADADASPVAEDVLQRVIAHDLGLLAREPEPADTGTHVGPYLLVRELASGGMGTVHLAVRSDDQYFQIVAVKMVRKGISTPELVQRFRAERQILATLTHPNVGTILDGGVTADGRPFMVMEFVEGQSITQASRTGALSLRRRIQLFQTLCSAVQHAHERLIVHRDIKPDNVLVTPEGLVKLIDFGIAQTLIPEFYLGGEADAKAGLQPLTPDYASPEQWTGQELTTATDIYSLGVLLFELLTDELPFRLQGLPPAAARAIVLAGMRTKPSATAGLDRRRRRGLVGDLDRIVLKAMATEPAARYTSVRAMDEDLGRYLEGRPLQTTKPRPLYKAGKFLKRQRVLVTTACVCVVILLLAAVSYGVRARQADKRVAQIRQLADLTIAQMTTQLQQVPASTEAQAAVFHRALDFLNGLEAETGGDGRLYLELSRAYLRVGEVEGSPAVPNLGNASTATMSYRAALKMALQAHDLLKSEDSTIAVIRAQMHLADEDVFLGDARRADEEYRSALGWALPFWRGRPTDRERTRLLTTVYLGLGDNALNKLLPNEASAIYAAALQVFGGEPTGEEDHDKLLIDLHLHQARALNEFGRLKEALDELNQCRQLAQTLARRFPQSQKARRELMVVDSSMVLMLSGQDFLNASRPERSLEYAREELGMARAAAESDRTNAQAGFDLALAQTKMGDAYREMEPATAARWYGQSIASTRAWLPRYGAESKHRVAIEDESLAEVLPGPGEAQQRLRLLLEAHTLRRELSDDSPHARLHLMRSFCELSDAQLAVNNVPAAVTAAGQALPLLAGYGLSSPSLMVLRDVGLCYASEGALQARLAGDTHRTAADRAGARQAAIDFFQQSARVWEEWARRGASTEESERERRRVNEVLQQYKKGRVG